MASSAQRIAIVAAVAHGKAMQAKENATSPEYTRYQNGGGVAHVNLHIFLAGATICGMLAAACVACCRARTKRPPARRYAPGVFTLSGAPPTHVHCPGYQEALGPVAACEPPPAYEAIVPHKDTGVDRHGAGGGDNAIAYGEGDPELGEIRGPCPCCAQASKPSLEDYVGPRPPHLLPHLRPPKPHRNAAKNTTTENSKDDGLPTYEIAIQLRDSKL